MGWYNMSECDGPKLVQRWIIVIMILIATFTLSYRVDDALAVFVAWVELLGIGVGWYFRDKVQTTET